MRNPPVVVALLLVRVVVGVTMMAHGCNRWRGGGKIAGTGRPQPEHPTPENTGSPVTESAGILP